MTVTQYKAGEKIDGLSVAGQDMERWSMFGITADVFHAHAVEREDRLTIPMIESEQPGSGNLDAFLFALKVEAKGTPIQFVNVINQGLAMHLYKHRIPFSVA